MSSRRDHNGELILFDPDRKARFLQLMRLTGQLQRSAQEAGIAPSTVRAHLKADPDFKAAHEEAYGDFKEYIESEIQRRAIMGWEEPVFQQGELAGTVRKYDSRLLELLAKRHIPEFKEKYEVNHNVSGGILVTPQQNLPAEEWAKSQEVQPDPEPEEPEDESRKTSR